MEILALKKGLRKMVKNLTNTACAAIAHERALKTMPLSCRLAAGKQPDEAEKKRPRTIYEARKRRVPFLFCTFVMRIPVCLFAAV